MYAHPLSFHASANGLGVGYPATPALTPDGRTYEYLHRDDLTVGVTGLNAPRTEVDSWSDWTVSPRWSDGARTFRATIGHGLPYVYGEVVAGREARVSFNGPATVWHNAGNVVGVTVNGHDYALFAPASTAWSLTGTASASVVAAYYSVAVLPSRAALPLFTKYAYCFVTDTKASWAYDTATARLSATYTATTTARQGPNAGTLLALYRHQWLNSTDTVTSHRYVSARGELRLREGSSFTTRSTFNGVLPALPLAGNADRGRLRAEIDRVLAEADPFKGASDTYWTGKALWRLAALVRVANQLGYTSARDRLLTLVRNRLTEWLTAGSGDTARLFAYDSRWGTLIGYPAAYGSDTELNDHHFHYGYYVLAAAVVAQHDRAWASDARYGGMIKLLVKDAANYDRADSRFPFLRNFDPYAGHSWASGHAGFGHGNNQESSSEAMMFATAAVLFGAATGDAALRNAGIYLYTTERTAIGEYWFDASNAVFPAGYRHDTLGILWGAGGAYATWWTANPEEIHGINMLPITGGSLYHAAWKSDVVGNVNELRASNGGPETEWTDVIWSFLALADPAQALSRYGGGVEPEWGESRAHTYHWLTSLNAFGTPDPSVTGNVPTAAVLSKAGGKTYVAYNGGAAAITAQFSDGATLAVPAGATAWRGPAGSGVDPGVGGRRPPQTR
jgi:endoglucanase Acf2